MFGEDLQAASHLFYLLLSGGILLLIYTNLRLLKIPWWLAAALSLLWMIYPAFIYFQHFLFYPILVQFLLLLAVFALQRGSAGSVSFLVLFFITLSFLFLTRSIFNSLFVAAVLAILLLSAPHSWKRILLAALPGLVIVLGFSLKNLLLFSQVSTSSWLGMNLANVALSGLSQQERQLMVSREGSSELVLLTPFEEISTYPHSLWQPISQACQGPDAYCQTHKTNGEPNLNFAGYIAVSSQFLKDDIAALRAYPGKVLKQVMLGWRIYFSPSLATVYVNKRATAPIRPWIGFTDKVLCGQEIDDVYEAQPCYQMQFGYLGTMILGLVTLLLRVHVGSAEKTEVVTLSFIFLVLVYSLVVGIIFDLGENNRFRLETDPLVLVLFGYWLFHIFRLIRRRVLVVPGRTTKIIDTLPL